ncbi:MAG: DEAD/DEAH box helicase [Thermoplasmata archaeon]|nr:DEAD/DEAH box helicase [Thermoplasmata archaeon]
MTDQTFSDFDLIKPIKHALTDVGYIEPTPIQLQAIPPLLAGRDLLGCAQTGTGKTAAFSLPIIQHLAKNRLRRERGIVRVLIVTPTRELAAQIFQNLEMYSRHLDVNSIVIFGGVGQGPQVKALNRGIDILVATPGRLLDLIDQGHIDLHKIEIFVLDEADRMLDMGFIHDIRRVLKHLPDRRQTMFFSATLPPNIIKLARTMVHDPVRVDVTPDKPVIESIDQRLMLVDMKAKTDVLLNILKDESVNRALVFTRTKHGANKLVKLMARADIEAEGIHGNKSQTARTAALADFKAGAIKVLVATDIAARGIDVEGITHVINHDIPNVAETYVHRIGRTARAGCQGISISLCAPEEKAFIKDIEKLIRQSIPVFDYKPYNVKVELKPAPKPVHKPKGAGKFKPRKQHGGGNRQAQGNRPGQSRSQSGGQSGGRKPNPHRNSRRNQRRQKKPGNRDDQFKR